MNIAVDFDGVVHKYSRGWHDGTIYDPPMPGAREACQQLLAAGHRLILFTTRVNAEADHDLAHSEQQLRTWLDEHGFHDVFDDITAVKPLCHLLIDDRAVRFLDWPQALADVDTYTQRGGGAR